MYIEWGPEKVWSPTAPAFIKGWGCGTPKFKSQQRVSGPADTIYFYNKVMIGYLNQSKKAIVVTLLELFFFYSSLKSYVWSSIKIQMNQPEQVFRHSNLINK